MLPAEFRLRKSADITATLRAGRRFASRLLVLHVDRGPDAQTRFAFAVGKNVGNSVARHRVTRQLRHLTTQSAEQFPAGSRVVVRALPLCQDASFAELSESFGAAVAKVIAS